MEGRRSDPVAEPAASPSEWEPEIRCGMFVPLQMRRRGTNGKWIYRAPTEQEIQDYLESEAW